MWILHARTVGTLGAGLFDSIINAAETVLAFCGLMVAKLGVQSCDTLDINIIKQYVYYLLLLALANIVERIAWVFDVVLQVWLSCVRGILAYALP
jgi:hypothetical protein